MGHNSSDSEEPVAEQLPRGANILHSGPPMSGGETQTCMELLDIADAHELNVLAITYKRNPGEWLADFRTHFDADPARLQIVSVSDVSRGTAAAAPSGADHPGNGRTVSIESPRDLTGLGIRISEFLQHIENTAADDEATATVMCFDSLTALLQFVDVQQAFRFLHVVTTRISSIGATAHYHIHPDAHDDRTIHTLHSVFDGRVTVGDDGIEHIVVP